MAAFCKLGKTLIYRNNVSWFTVIMCQRWSISFLSPPPVILFFCFHFMSFGLSRILAFSPSGVTSVKVWLDGQPLPPTTRVQGGPLYTTPWDPQRVARGLHTITVTAEVSRRSVCLFVYSSCS